MIMQGTMQFDDPCPTPHISKGDLYGLFLVPKWGSAWYLYSVLRWVTCLYWLKDLCWALERAVCDFNIDLSI